MNENNIAAHMCCLCCTVHVVCAVVTPVPVILSHPESELQALARIGRGIRVAIEVSVLIDSEG